jgi:non-ribosomal peptide synthase protein (TIGR01720 family)
MQDCPRLPIGKPIANCKAYVLDPVGHGPVPIGAPGELYLGGKCVGPGYINDSALTESKFQKKQIGASSELLYRTGDRVRWMVNGNLDFLGRLDQQIKIRGNRIEPGEISSLLEEHSAVSSAAVTAQYLASGEKELVAYFVPSNGQTVDSNELLRFLGQRLPPFMIPRIYIAMERIPLTQSGKLDRRSLPVPQKDSGLSKTLPRTPTEQTLCNIWRELLGQEAVGIDDNFFDLGGDSILSIQVVARAQAAGLRLSPQLVFKHQTVAGLAAASESMAVAETEREGPSDEIPLTPIQKRFVSTRRSATELNHFNQAVIVKLKRKLPAQIVRQAVEILVDHHDALRLRLGQIGGQWRQRIASQEGIDKVYFTVDLRHLHDPGQVRSAIESSANSAEKSLDILSGPMFRVGLFECRDCDGDRLLVVAHHLAFDGVSWRILLHDFEATCEQLMGGQSVQLGPKTTRYLLWAKQLQAFAQSTDSETHKEYWAAMLEEAHDLPRDLKGDNTYGSTEIVTSSLSERDTNILIHQLASHGHLKVNHILLTALLRTYQMWTGRRLMVVDIEHHGRECLFDQTLDLSRTVGWFTAMCPVKFTLADGASLNEQIMTVKQQYDSAMVRVLEYGLLRYSIEDPFSQGIRDKTEPEVCFNYLGQLDQVFTGSRLFEQSSEDVGQQIDAETPRFHKLDVTCFVINNQLHMNLTYGKNIHLRETVERLLTDLVKNIRDLTDHVASSQQQFASPEDFPLADIDSRDLAKVLQREKRHMAIRGQRV